MEKAMQIHDQQLRIDSHLIPSEKKIWLPNRQFQQRVPPTSNKIKSIQQLRFRSRNPNHPNGGVGGSITQNTVTSMGHFTNMPLAEALAYDEALSSSVSPKNRLLNQSPIGQAQKP